MARRLSFSFRSSAFAVCAALLGVGAFGQSTTVPAPVVASSSTVIATGLNQPQGLALDAKGNLFIANANAGTVVEYPASGGPSVVVSSQSGSYNKGVAVDSLGNIFTTSYGGNIYKTPAGGTTSTAFASGSTCPDFAAIGYYIGFQDVSADALGNIYAAGQGKSYLFKFNQAGACTEILTPTQLGTNAVNNVTADAAGDVYYSVNNSIYYLAAGSSSPTQVLVAGIAGVNALKVDSKGNLFITDSMTIDEIPFINGALAPTKLTYVIPFGSPYTVAISPSGQIYASNFAGNTVMRFAIGSLALAPSNVGTMGASGVISYLFNTAEVPTSFSYVAGPAATTVFSTTAPAAMSTTTCAVGTAYAPSTGAAPSFCTLNVAMNPSTPGKNVGAVLFNTATGTQTTTYLAGTGTGAALTVFPGTQTTLGTFTTPSTIRVDSVGDVFVADSAKNTVTELPAGGGAGVVVGSGLSMPQGLALSPAGDLFIADTGNNRIVEVPYTGGALKTAAQTVVATGLSGPTGLALDLAGNIVVANTGAGTVLVIPNEGGVTGAAPTYAIGTGLKKPTAVAVDAANNIFIADATAGNVVELAAATGAQTNALSNLTNLAGLAVNANDDIFLTQTGSATITKIPFTGGSYATNNTVALGTGLTGPAGIAMDSAGDLFIADAAGGMAYEIQRTVGSLAFGKVNTGTSSAAQALSLSNAGNVALTFSSPFFKATAGNTGDFAVTAAANNGCAAGLATGVSCGASVTFSPLAAGARTETIAFQSNAVNAATVGAMFNGTGANSAPTTLTLTVTPSGTISFGQTIMVTATVAPVTTSTAKPSGFVQFSVDGSAYGAPVALSSTSTATQSITGLSGGAHTINATYTGDGNFASAAATAPLSLTIATAATTTQVTTTINGATATATGTSVTLTAMVTSSSTPPPYPSGSVAFFQAGNPVSLGSAPLVNGVASFTTTALPNGQYNVTGVYSGDVDFSMSTSAGVAVFISPPTYVLSNAASSLTVPRVGSATTTFTLTPIAGYMGSVYLSCSGLPSYATCSFNPGGADFTLTGTQNVQLAITTGVPPPQRGSIPWLPAVLTLGVLTVCAGRKRLPRLLMVVLVLISGAGVTASLSGCASSALSTPSGSSAVTVQLNGTPGPTGGNIIESFTLNVTVQ